MSEVTQAYSPAADSPNKTATGVDLAPVLITPSKILWRIELTVYSGILIAASVALFPFFLTVFYWPILWLVFLALVLLVLRERWRVQKLPAVTVSVQKQIWRLKNPTGEFTVVPFDEVLLWSGVIILPVREILSGRKHRILILRDSVTADDWRRLRVWLRTGLRNNL